MSEFIQIQIDQLDLDPENPRLPERLKSKNTVEGDVLNWMLEDATLIDLMASIAENGFFEGEPILAVKNNKRYIVIEGNRRLAALKILSNPALSNISHKTISSLS